MGSPRPSPAPAGERLLALRAPGRRNWGLWVVMQHRWLPSSRAQAGQRNAHPSTPLTCRSPAGACRRPSSLSRGPRGRVAVYCSYFEASRCAALGLPCNTCPPSFTPARLPSLHPQHPIRATGIRQRWVLPQTSCVLCQTA